MLQFLRSITLGRANPVKLFVDCLKLRRQFEVRHLNRLP
jgi:hypothetical protein